MRNRIVAALVVALAALLLATHPVVAEAAKQITGKQIKNGSVTGKDIKDNSLKGADIDEGSLGRVPSAATAGSAASAASADGLTNLPSGATQSGAFSAATNGPAGGYLGFDITYPRALDTPIPNGNIIDTATNPNPAVCPGAGRAAPGYLCLYFQFHTGIGQAYGWSTNAPYNAPSLGKSVGVGLYAPVTAPTNAYANGVWTVTAP